MIRFGQASAFDAEPVQFRQTTVQAVKARPREEQLARFSALALANATNLLLAVETVQRLGIGAYRIPPCIFPLMTHATLGYDLNDLPNAAAINKCFSKVKRFCKKEEIRLLVQPDKKLNLSSSREETVDKGLRTVAYLGMLGHLAGANAIVLRVGGKHGGKPAALARFQDAIARVPDDVRKMLALENDDMYTPRDLLAVCMELRIPLVYDVHWHRCNGDGLTERDATRRCLDTWARADREPVFRVASPEGGWAAENPGVLAAYVAPDDFPAVWLDLRHITIDVEARAKERAIVLLREKLALPPFAAG